jgi:N-acetylated-alpha-linked acidic dipeptidase
MVLLMPILLPCRAQTIRGFFDATTQLQVERQFDAAIRPANIGSMIRTLSARQHHLGSTGSKAVALQVSGWMKSWGLDARLETYQVLFPTPKTRVLEMGNYRASLTEGRVAGDTTTGQPDELPPYNAWSPDGDVTAPLVFVNFGLPEDYAILQRMGVSVKGKIVIAKYGKSWRGIKPKVAQENGAVGCIIYSDPNEDGFRKGDVYPFGPYKHPGGVQRGSVMDMPIYPGDPSTPFVPSLPGTRRLSHLEAPNLLKIPVLPISYKDAQPLLASLQGPTAPADWQGGLPITYKIGPGSEPVHLQVAFDWQLVDCHNVIGRIAGSLYPDEWVIRGNHHDAWTYGANDPLSGLSALLEEARVLGEMSKNGWRPKRTMVFIGWDGEEPGLLGSTEWVEHHAAELREKCVAYINSDANGRGFLDAGGSHALETMMDEVAKEVLDPLTGVNVYERKRAAAFIAATDLQARKNISGTQRLTLSALGSGSDYSAFLQHLGLTTLNLGFGGHDHGGEYHTNFDTYQHYERFKDPGFEYGAALSKVAGRAALRLANADVLPYDFDRLHKTIEGYLKDLMNFNNNYRETAQMESLALNDRFYQLAKDPSAPLLPPMVSPEVPLLDFSAVTLALQQLEMAAQKAKSHWEKSKTYGNKLAQLNKKLYQAEQQLLNEEGLPRRKWYRHSLYAPGFYTGYGVKTLPGVREAMEQKNFKEATEQIQLLAQAIERLARHLNTLQP